MDLIASGRGNFSRIKMSPIQELLAPLVVLLGKLEYVTVLIYTGEIFAKPYSAVLDSSCLEHLGKTKKTARDLASSILAKLRQSKTTPTSTPTDDSFNLMYNTLLQTAEPYIVILSPNLEMLEKFKRESVKREYYKSLDKMIAKLSQKDG